MQKVSAILAVYIGGLLIGLCLVSFPASSAFLMERLALTDQEYGAIYLPQLVLAIIGALGGGAAVKKLSLKSMYIAALASFALSQICLLYAVFSPPAAAHFFLMAGTAFFGFGFGFGGGPLNGLASLLFDKHANSAITFLHMSAGLGLTLGPLVFAAGISAGAWENVPAILAVVALALLGVSYFTTFREPPKPAETATVASPSKSTYFWLIMAVAVFYALAEGTLANWAILYARDAKGLSPTSSALTLSAFWGALTIGRLLVTFLLMRVKAIVVWLTLAPLMAIAFFLLPMVEGEFATIATFAYAGLACSAFFPLMVAVCAEPFPESVSYIASMLTAALMFGVGIGSYVIGSFREAVSLDTLYLLSAAYPITAFILIIVARQSLKKKQRAATAAAAPPPGA